MSSFDGFVSRLMAALFVIAVFAVGADTPAAAQSPAVRGAFCANEDGRCRFSGTQFVYYGAGDSYAVRSFTHGTDCTNAVFGDPAPGVRKACYVAGVASPARRSAFCANEDQRCRFSGTQYVYYGAGDRFVARSLSNGVNCSNAVFGDPAPGVRKACYLAEAIGSAVSAPGGRSCADEGGYCRFNGARYVYYGAGDHYVARRLTNGTECTNTVFGDPTPGVRKACYLDAPGGR